MLNAALLVGILEIVLGIFLSMLAVFQSDWVMHFLHIDESLLEMSQVYFQIYACGIVLVFLYDGGRSVLVGCEDSKNPFYLVMVGSLCNVILDYLMIGGFQNRMSGYILRK